MSERSLRTGRQRAVLLVVIACACGRTQDARPGPSDSRGATARDLVRLRVVLEEDPVEGALADVERQVSLRRRVRAAEILSTVATPAADAHLREFESLRFETGEGLRLRDVLLDAYRTRQASFESYRAILVRGEIDDIPWFDATQAQRRAAEKVISAHDAIAQAQATLVGRSPR